MQGGTAASWMQNFAQEIGVSDRCPDVSELQKIFRKITNMEMELKLPLFSECYRNYRKFTDMSHSEEFLGSMQTAIKSVRELDSGESFTIASLTLRALRPEVVEVDQSPDTELNMAGVKI